MIRDLQRLTLLILLGFSLVAGSTFFWTVIQRDSLLARDDNPRKVLAELNIQRGSIYDRNGIRLAYTEAAADPALGPRRVYPYPEVVSAVGHYSYRYGQAGLEEGYHDLLRAVGLRDTRSVLEDNLLNRFPLGGDLRSTLDLRLQQALFNAMQGYRGAGILASAPSGEVLAMVSLPAYDPNQVDAIGRLLNANNQDDDETIRLLNRVTDGQYQPGGALQTLLLSAMLASGVSPDAFVAVGDVQLERPPLTLTCALPTPESELRLAQAYLRGCPAPFWTAPAFSITSEMFGNILQAAGFQAAPQLGGFRLPQPMVTPITYTSPQDIFADAVGQGRLTVTPLHMLQVIAAVVNRGNGIPLHLDAATRYPAHADWQPIRAKPSRLALMQPSIAQTIQAILRARSFDEALPIYGHVSQAYAGSREYAWFLGWTPLEDGTDAVIVVVLEADQIEPMQAVEVAVTTLRATHQVNED